MYTVYYYRNNEVNTFITDDIRAAYIVAYNEVRWLGCEEAHVTTNETGEILRSYIKGWRPCFLFIRFNDLTN